MGFKTNFISMCSATGKTPSAVCRAIGITPTAYSHWSEDSVPRETTLTRLCNVFGCSRELLLFGTEKAEEKPVDYTPQEIALLSIYRTLTPTDQLEVISYLMSKMAK